MNLQDLKEEGIDIENELQDIKDIINTLISVINSKEELKSNAFSEIFNVGLISNNTTIVVQQARQLYNLKEEYCNKFYTALRDINFTRSIVKLTKMNKEYKYFKFKDFYNKYFEMVDIVHEYLANRMDNKMSVFDRIEVVYNSVKRVVDSYNLIIHDNEQITKISNELYGIDDKNLKIRFMNENKSISSLKENIILIESIYNNVNKLVGNSEELTYSRAESGLFMLWLAGCATTLLTMKPLLEFAYKVYSEQFSPEAKIDLELKEVELQSKKVKLRGDYIKLIKDATESKTIQEFNVKDKTEFINIIGNLDMDIKKLYSNNPYIRLDDEDLGLKNNSIEKVPIEMIESADEDIKELEDLMSIVN